MFMGFQYESSKFLFLTCIILEKKIFFKRKSKIR